MKTPIRAWSLASLKLFWKKTLYCSSIKDVQVSHPQSINGSWWVKICWFELFMWKTVESASLGLSGIAELSGFLKPLPLFKCSQSFILLEAGFQRAFSPRGHPCFPLNCNQKDQYCVKEFPLQETYWEQVSISALLGARLLLYVQVILFRPFFFFRRVWGWWKWEAKSYYNHASPHDIGHCRPTYTIVIHMGLGHMA